MTASILPQLRILSAKLPPSIQQIQLLLKYFYHLWRIISKVVLTVGYLQLHMQLIWHLEITPVKLFTVQTVCPGYIQPD